MKEETEARILLEAACRCIESCRELHELRPIVKKFLPVAYECIDQSLTAQLELLSLIMLEYQVRDSGFTADGAEEIGREPESYDDAVERLGWFLRECEALIVRALKENAPCQYAQEIETRAFTFSCLLRNQKT